MVHVTGRPGFIVAAFMLILSAAQARGGDTFAFVDVNVVPMTGHVVLRRQTVVVANETIVAMGPSARVAVPSGALTISGRGRYLMPGLTDAHVHLFTAPELALYLANGVTTVFNLNGAPAHLYWKRAIAAGGMIGPTVYTTGPTFMTKRSREEAVAGVTEQAAAGFDGIKIYNGVGVEEYGALVETARAKQMLVIGHVPREVGAETALRARQSIAHAEEFVYSFFNPNGGDGFAGIVFDESRIPALVSLAASSGVSVVPTIATFRDIIMQATRLEKYLSNGELRYLHPRIRATLQPGINRYQNRYSVDDLRQLRRALPFQRRLVRALNAAGVPLLAGSDATAIGPVAGFSLHDELEELVRSGLTPYDALRTATVNPARYLGRVDRFGTVEVGKAADLVLVEGNPLSRITNTRRIAGVMRNGEWLDSAALQRMLATVPAAYADTQAELLRLIGTDLGAAERFVRNGDPFGIVGSAALAELASSSTPEELQALFDRLDRRVPDSWLAREEALNELGYLLLTDRRPLQAVAVFEANARRHPRSANALDSLAEGYLKLGQTRLAVETYGKALAVEPGYGNAAFARKFIEEHPASDAPPRE
jgi:cytosine/adenosine deaminase-related metal-dependent hydrolase